MKKTSLTLAAVVALAAPAHADVASNIKVFDHTKTITKYVPTTTYVCNEIKKPVYGNVQKQGDAAGGALLGMILGGVIGKGVTGDDGGAAAGAVVGGLIGADKGAQNRTSREIIGYEIVEQCENVTRNSKENVEVYSHSTIRFYLNGKRYVVPFQK